MAENQLATLAELTKTTNHILELIAYSEGELTEEVEQWLTVTQTQLVQKTDNYALFFEKADSEIDFLKQQASFFTKAARQLSNTIDRLKDHMKEQMRLMDTTELDGHYYRFKLSKTKPKVLINEDLLPAEYTREKVIIEPDKTKIYEDAQTGKQIPGVTLQESWGLRKYAAKKAGK